MWSQHEAISKLGQILACSYALARGEHMVPAPGKVKTGE